MAEFVPAAIVRPQEETGPEVLLLAGAVATMILLPTPKERYHLFAFGGVAAVLMLAMLIHVGTSSNNIDRLFWVFILSFLCFFARICTLAEAVYPLQSLELYEASWWMYLVALVVFFFGLFVKFWSSYARCCNNRHNEVKFE
jgi:hypothetical protein